MIDYPHKTFNNYHSQGVALRWVITGQPIDWVCVTLNFIVQIL